MIWVKNTAGKPDAMLTIATLFALAGLARFLLGGVDFGGRALQPLESADVIALLGTIGAYVARRGQKPAAP